MAWEIFVDDRLCRITGSPADGYKLSIFDPAKGATDRSTLPPGTSLDAAKVAAHQKVVDIAREHPHDQITRGSGRVKWFNGAKGYGFILASPDTVALTKAAAEPFRFDREGELFVHWSSVLMDGERELLDADSVEFELRRAPRGSVAANVIRTQGADSENWRELLQLRRDRLALAMVDGAISVICVNPERKVRYLDSQQRFHGLLYLPRASFGRYHDAVEELESLINQYNVREQALHDFFERYPDFLLPDDYKAAHSKIVLESDSSDLLVPDFVLEPIGQDKLCDLLELKLPNARVEVLQDRRKRFSAAVLEACAQLRTYRDYFEESANRGRFREKYGLSAFRPRMYVIIGRRGAIDAVEWRRIEDDMPMLHLKTYDDILERAKHILGRLGTFHTGS